MKMTYHCVPSRHSLVSSTITVPFLLRNIFSFKKIKNMIQSKLKVERGIHTVYHVVPPSSERIYLTSN